MKRALEEVWIILEEHRDALWAGEGGAPGGFRGLRGLFARGHRDALWAGEGGALGGG